MIIHDDLEALCAQYEGFLLDLWGVVMDGIQAFPDALKWLARRRMEQKPVWFLSNASRTTAATATLLTNLGISPKLYAGISTSGQLAVDALSDPHSSFATGALYAVGEMPKLHGWPPTVMRRFTTHLDQAAFLIALGSFPLTELDQRLAPLLDALDKPMLCANPDRDVVFGGQPLAGAGMLAERFAEAGGTVHWFGKPELLIFAQGEAQLQKLGAQQMLFIGDSMVTDIPGARRAGLDTLLLSSTGIHRETLGAEFNRLPSPTHLKHFLEGYEIQPNGVAAGLS